MPDDKKILNNIEQARFEQETIQEKEHFLEEDFEKVKQPERSTEKSALERTPSMPEGVASDEISGGIVAQGIYDREQEQRKREIEKVLEKGLGDIYVNLPPEKRQEFKVVGEETAGKISELLGKGKVKMQKIISLIRKWLTLIPGVNRFFLEQEVKIKADEIMKLK